MTEEATERRGPTLRQGCMLSFWVVVLAFGGCLASGVLQSDILLELSMAGFVLAGLVGLVLLIARFDQWLRGK